MDMENGKYQVPNVHHIWYISLAVNGRIYIYDQWDLSTKTHFSSLVSAVLPCGMFRVRFGCEHGSAHGIWLSPKSRASLLDMIMIDHICFILMIITLFRYIIIIGVIMLLLLLCFSLIMRIIMYYHDHVCFTSVWWLLLLLLSSVLLYFFSYIHC